MKRIVLPSLFLLLTELVFAQVQLPRFFSDNMVLQRDHVIPVWGRANPGEKITVRLHGQSKSVTTSKSGLWRVDLAAESNGGPYTLTVQGKDKKVINNVLIGDVWICSGQSNMEMPIGPWGMIDNYKVEIAQANYPEIRQFLVPRTTAASPQYDFTGGDWQPCNPGTAATFSATAYFFAREIYNRLKIPIGIINTSWGGTMVETWSSREAFENDAAFKEMIAGMKQTSIEGLIQEQAAIKQQMLKKLQGPVPPTDSEVATWKTTAFNDQQWMTIKAPGMWEQQQLADFDGVVWYRKNIDVPEATAGKAALLELSMIDDDDETYINGELVGKTSGYNVARKYTIAAGMLKTGRNVIAIRVNDTGGGGGIYGDSANLKLSTSNWELSLAGPWKINVASGAPVSNSIGPNSFPTLLYNGMIHPLVPYAIKGAIWYQGETNAGRAYEYRKSFPLMIRDWRSKWQQGDFPFYFVQLSSWNANSGNSNKGSDWAELREAQSLTLTLPNTGMAVTTDIGDSKDIHPKNKQDVGKRLALLALEKTYGQQLVAAGPTYQAYQKQGNQLLVIFSNTGSGLLAKDKYGYLRGFEVAGADKVFHYAQAFIRGNQVVISSDAVNDPVALRYSWADDAGESNLFNREGLPAAPFRTDDWKGITEDIKYEIGR